MTIFCSRLVVVLLFFPLSSFAQQQFSGFITDNQTGKPIPYATIGLIRENKGVSADKLGAFSINAVFPEGDSLRISSVGYESGVWAVKDWVNGQTAELQRKKNLLGEVVISDNGQQEITLNQFPHCSWNYFRIGLNAVQQLAQQYQAPEAGMRLTGLEFCKDAGKSFFRLRVYDADSISESPGKDLVDTVIDVRTRATHVELDLEKYNIIIPGTSFFVAVEWLFIPFNSVTTKVKRSGKKTEWTYYKPELRYVRRQDGEAKIWVMRFDGRWYVMNSMVPDPNFQISVKLR